MYMKEIEKWCLPGAAFWQDWLNSERLWLMIWKFALGVQVTLRVLPMDQGKVRMTQNLTGQELFSFSLVHHYETVLMWPHCRKVNLTEMFSICLEMLHALILKIQFYFNYFWDGDVVHGQTVVHTVHYFVAIAYYYIHDFDFL